MESTSMTNGELAAMQSERSISKRLDKLEVQVAELLKLIQGLDRRTLGLVRLGGYNNRS